MNDRRLLTEYAKALALALALAAPGALSFLPAVVHAAGAATESDVKAAYIYNFLQLVDWPARESGATAGPIKICVIGGLQLGEALSGLSGRQAGGRPIEVSSSSAAGDGLAACHVVVAGPGAQDALPIIFEKLKGADVLTVGDIPRFARKGGIIGFMTENGRVKIEINIHTARRAGLKISGRLMEVARVIR